MEEKRKAFSKKLVINPTEVPTPAFLLIQREITPVKIVTIFTGVISLL
jgi:hypothetical protein